MAIIQKSTSKKRQSGTTEKASKSDCALWWKQQSFDFVQVPKDLFRAHEYRQLSPLSKLLYSFLLDRMNLSYSKGDRWKNDHNEYYVYFPISEIMERFNCGHDKAAALLRELETANLVTRKLKGRGLPYQITVKPFISIAKLPQTESRENRDADLEESDRNKTEFNSTDLMHPELITCGSRESIKMMIKRNISYEVLLEHIDKDILEGIINIMTDILHHDSPYIKILGEPIPRKEVREKILRMNEMHIQYVFHRVQKENHSIQNPRSYIMARLYEAEDVMDSYYEMQVNHDIAST